MRVYAVSVNAISHLLGRDAIESDLNDDLATLVENFHDTVVHQMVATRAGATADLVLFLYSYEEEEVT